jgi:putative flippase GtrA
MDMGAMALMVSLLHWNDVIGKIVTQVIVTIANYIFSKVFVFKKKD